MPAPSTRPKGATVDRAFLLGSDQLYREAGYVGMSRGRLSNELFVVASRPGRWRRGRRPRPLGPLAPSRSPWTRSPNRAATGQALARRPAAMGDRGPRASRRSIGPDRQRWAERAAQLASYRDTYGVTDERRRPRPRARGASRSAGTGSSPGWLCSTRAVSRPRKGTGKMNLPALLRNVLVSRRPRSRRHGGIYLGWGTKGPVLARPDEHLLVIGPPRSGKTTRLLAFSVLCHPGPVVVTSTKPDVIGLTSWARERLGRVWLWDPSGTLDVPEGVEELRWSPVVGCSDLDEAVARAYALSSSARPTQSVHDTHWIERAQALARPAAARRRPRRWRRSPPCCPGCTAHQLLAPITVLKDNGSDRAAELLEGIAHTEARELSGIFSTADSLLSAYRTDAALRAASAPNFDPAAFAVPARHYLLVCPHDGPGACTLRWSSRSSTRSVAPSTRLTRGRRCCSPWTSWPRSHRCPTSPRWLPRAVARASS